MNEQEFIQKIKALKQIKPDDGWIALTKSQILAQNQPTQVKQDRVPAIYVLKHMFRPMTLAPIALSFVVGLFLLGQLSLPGDTLRPVKKITETTQETLVRQENKSEFYLDLAGKRANELKQVAAAHQPQKLSPAIQECQASIKRATESLVEATKEPEPEQVVVLVQKMVELKQTIQEIEQDLDIEIGEIGELEETTMACLNQGIETTENKLENTRYLLVSQQIENLENSSLTEEQEIILKEVKQLYEDGNYSEALRKIFPISYQ